MDRPERQRDLIHRRIVPPHATVRAAGCVTVLLTHRVATIDNDFAGRSGCDVSRW